MLIKHTDIEARSLICPGGEKGRSHYALNENALRLGKDAPEDMVLMFECAPGWNQIGGPELLKINHKGRGCNVLLVGYHPIYVKTEELDTLRWTVDKED